MATDADRIVDSIVLIVFPVLVSMNYLNPMQNKEDLPD